MVEIDKRAKRNGEELRKIKVMGALTIENRITFLQESPNNSFFFRCVSVNGITKRGGIRPTLLSGQCCQNEKEKKIELAKMKWLVK